MAAASGGVEQQWFLLSKEAIAELATFGGLATAAPCIEDQCSSGFYPGGTQRWWLLVGGQDISGSFLGGLGLLMSPSGGTECLWVFGWRVKAASSWWGMWSATVPSGVGQKTMAPSPEKSNIGDSFLRGNEQKSSSFFWVWGMKW